MKPKNKFQKQVLCASKKLPQITEAQVKWAQQNCFEHNGYRTKKGVVTCLVCGHEWQGNSELSDTLLGGQCSFCAAKLNITTTRKSVLKAKEYMCILSVSNGLQALRFFHVEAYFKKGQKAQYSINEVAQRWIAPDGKFATVAKLRTMSCYLDLWNFNSNLEIRPERPLYNIMPTCIYPRQRFIPELKRNGYKGDCHEINPFDLFYNLLTNRRAETLLKAGETNVLKYYTNRRFASIANYWASIKICIRNNFHIEDTSIWHDYIDLLRFFGKDLHNAKYVCPADLKAEHDRYVQKKREWQERQKREEIRKKLLEDAARFNELKSKFFGIQFTDGLIHVRVLESVEEIMQEGDILHHCVFVSNYHLKPDSLILSAYIGDKRLETIEISMPGLKVLQCRGVCNENTEYHDRIIALVKKNIPQIRKRLKAA
jgi:hypothetical protein